VDEEAFYTSGEAETYAGDAAPACCGEE